MTKAGGIANSNSNYLVEIYAYDVAAAAERVLRFGVYELLTEPDDSPANVQYHARLQQAYSYQAKMYQKDNALFGPVDTDLGSFALSFDASASISEHNYSMVDMLDLEYTNRRVIVRRGDKDGGFSGYSIIRDGFISERPKLDGTFLVFSFSSMEQKLNKPIQENLYIGDNGVSGTAKEGKEELEGVPKILVLGSVDKVTPVEVNSPGQIYQVHDGRVKSISNVAVNENSLNFNSDLTGTAFDNWTKVPGEYITDLQRGYLMLGSPLLSGETLTCDVEGAYDGTTFPSSHSQIIKWILENAGVTSFDTSSFTAHHSADGAAAGVIIRTEITAQDLIGQLLISCGSWGGENAAQEYRIGQVSEPKATADHQLGHYVNGVKITRISEPFHRMRFSYGPDEEDLEATARRKLPTGRVQSGVITDALGVNDKNTTKANDFVTGGDVTMGEVSSPASFKSTYLGAIDGDVRRTFYRLKADAMTELNRELAIFDKPLRFYQLDTSLAEGHGVSIGDTSEFDWSDLTLSSAKMVVIDLKTTAGGSSSGTTLWGYA